MKTDFGTFDISTAVGRQKWLQALNVFNDKTTKQRASPPLVDNSKFLFSSSKTEDKKPNDSVDLSEPNSASLSASLPLSSGSVCESAKIEFIIPKNHNHGLSVFDGNSMNAKKPFVNPVIERKPLKIEPEKTTKDATVVDKSEKSNVEDVEKQPVVMTLNELKEKLQDADAKNYRRLFLPGRGWVSSKKLQGEVSALETSDTSVTGSTKLSLKDDCGLTSEAEKSAVSASIILGVATAAQIAAAEAFALANPPLTNNNKPEAMVPTQKVATQKAIAV